jgi:hypothetical protein
MWYAVCNKHHTSFSINGACPLCEVDYLHVRNVHKSIQENKDLDGVLWGIHRFGLEHKNNEVKFISVDLSTHFSNMLTEFYYVISENPNKSQNETGFLVCTNCGEINMRRLTCKKCETKLKQSYEK